MKINCSIYTRRNRRESGYRQLHQWDMAWTYFERRVNQKWDSTLYALSFQASQLKYLVGLCQKFLPLLLTLWGGFRKIPLPICLQRSRVFHHIFECCKFIQRLFKVRLGLVIFSLHLQDTTLKALPKGGQ